MKIVSVDCNYVAPEFATSYLLIQNQDGVDRGFFVECNTNYAIPYLKAAAQKEGLSPEQIDGLIITHVHLDHAGGAGLFLKEFPNAKLYAHPRAARHAIDPAKLIQSATLVYGEEFMQKLYGTILPCSADRVVVVDDGEKIKWGNHEFETKHTRGHANHHLCVIEPETRTLFSGDSFGVSYPELNKKHGFVIIPSTSPTDFDGPAAIQTVEWVRDQMMEQIALTHFGFLPKTQIVEAARQLIDYLQFSIDLVQKIKYDQLSAGQTAEQIRDWFVHYYKIQGIQLNALDLKMLKIDIDVNAQGLVFAAKR